MATESDSSQVSDEIRKLELKNENDLPLNSKNSSNLNPEYGLPLADVYRLALSFFKEKEGKAVFFGYEDKTQLLAFSKQVLHGPYVDAVDKLPPLGALDVVGKDRRLAWQKLGNLSADQARMGFIELLSRKCPLFSAYIEAHRMEKKEQERLAEIEKQKRVIEEKELKKKEEEEQKVKEAMEKEEIIKRQIQQALNEQTYEQFRKYAEHQYPGDPEKQGLLVKQLQEQHYIQYMLQIQMQKTDISSLTEKITCAEVESSEKNDLTKFDANESKLEPCIVSASMWTRSDIDAFKKAVSQAEGDGVVRVGHGETVTVRVPTHHEGSRLFWEFATDHYDIGFGVYFEFGTPESNQVSVHVSDSDDEDADELDEEDAYEDETIHTGDLEAGSFTVNGVAKPLLTEIVPVFRRDCQTEVYAGSHQYPGEGVYLLKFDNSYSLWRSKTLYYRVYYTQ